MWSEAKLTNAGKKIHAELLANKMKLKIEEIWFGDGAVSDIEQATDLGHKKIKADIISVIQDGVDCKVRFRVSNRGTQDAITLREIGFYVRNADAQLVLFSAMTDDTPATLPVMGANGETRHTLTVAFGYSNAENVTVDGTVTEGLSADEVRQEIKTHDEATDAHKKQFDKKADKADFMAFKSNVIDIVGGHNMPLVIKSIIDWERMKSLNNGVDVRDAVNSQTGITAYSGDATGYDFHRGDIYLSEDFTTFDKILIISTTDTGTYRSIKEYDVCVLDYLMSQPGPIDIGPNNNNIWQINPRVQTAALGRSGIVSTNTLLAVNNQNTAIVDIVGIKYERV